MNAKSCVAMPIPAARRCSWRSSVHDLEKKALKKSYRAPTPEDTVPVHENPDHGVVRYIQGQGVQTGATAQSSQGVHQPSEPEQHPNARPGRDNRLPERSKHTVCRRAQRCRWLMDRSSASPALHSVKVESIRV